MSLRSIADAAIVVPSFWSFCQQAEGKMPSYVISLDPIGIMPSKNCSSPILIQLVWLHSPLAQAWQVNSALFRPAWAVTVAANLKTWLGADQTVVLLFWASLTVKLLVSQVGAVGVTGAVVNLTAKTGLLSLVISLRGTAGITISTLPALFLSQLLSTIDLVASCSSVFHLFLYDQTQLLYFEVGTFSSYFQS